MQLSEDEIKVLVTLLEQLNYKLEGAAIVLPILKKLKSEIKQPDLEPAGDADPIVPDEPVNPTPEVVEPTP